MPKSQNLRSRLKMADRRRRRRLADKSASNGVSPNQPDVDSPTQTLGSQGPDVVGLLTEAALGIAEKRRDVRDASIVGALRAIVNNGEPKSVPAPAVYQSMLDRLERAQVSDAEGEKGAAALLKISLENVDPNVHDQLIKFLSLIAS